jgi:hypothetical protein
MVYENGKYSTKINSHIIFHIVYLSFGTSRFSRYLQAFINIQGGKQFCSKAIT